MSVNPASYITESRRVSDSCKVPARLAGRVSPAHSLSPGPGPPCTPRSFTRSVRGPWERPISFLSLWSFYRTTEKCFGGVLTK